MKINLNKPNNQKKKLFLEKDNKDNRDEIILDPFAGQMNKSKKTKEKTQPEVPTPRQKKEAKSKAKIKEVSDKVSQPEKKSFLQKRKDKKEEKLMEARNPRLAELESERPKVSNNPLGDMRKNNQRLFKLVLTVVAIVLVFILGTQLMSAMRSIKNGTYLESSQVMMPDVTGFSEDAAKEKLRSVDINVSVEYMYDKLFNDGEVIKCSVDPDNPVEKGSTIKMYVCKKTNMTEVPKGVGYFDDLILPDCPCEKNMISLNAATVDDVYLNLKFQNKTTKTLKALKYTIGIVYTDGSKRNKEYTIDNLDVAPLGTFEERIELTDPEISQITFEFIRTLTADE